MADRKAAAQKAARTRKLRAAGKKAARTRRLRAAGKKAALTKKRRAAARRAAATRKLKKEQSTSVPATVPESARRCSRSRGSKAVSNDPRLPNFGESWRIGGFPQ